MTKPLAPAPRHLLAALAIKLAVTAFTFFGVGLLVTTTGCGGKSLETQRVKIPPVSNMREAAETLWRDADQLEGPPSWMNHERVVNRHVYGVGTARAKRDPAQDLFSAMQNGREVVLSSLREAGLKTASPQGFVDELPVDRERIQFADLAYDTTGRKWYVLAVLSEA